MPLVFAHVTRHSADYVDDPRGYGGPISIVTLAGDHRTWNEATPHVHKAFPIVFSKNFHTRGTQLTRARSGDPQPQSAATEKSRAYDYMFLRPQCPKCASSCDMRITEHWGAKK